MTHASVLARQQAWLDRRGPGGFLNLLCAYVLLESGFAARRLVSALLVLAHDPPGSFADAARLAFIVVSSVAVVAAMMLLLRLYARRSVRFPTAVVAVVSLRSILAIPEIVWATQVGEVSFAWSAVEFALLSAGRAFAIAYVMLARRIYNTFVENVRVPFDGLFYIGYRSDPSEHSASIEHPWRPELRAELRRIEGTVNQVTGHMSWTGLALQVFADHAGAPGWVHLPLFVINGISLQSLLVREHSTGRHFPLVCPTRRACPSKRAAALLESRYEPQHDRGGERPSPGGRLQGTIGLPRRSSNKNFVIRTRLALPSQKTRDHEHLPAKRRTQPASRAQVWFKELESGDVASRAELARKHGVPRAYVTQLLRRLAPSHRTSK
jgi:hypothetical protein